MRTYSPPLKPQGHFYLSQPSCRCSQRPLTSTMFFRERCFECFQAAEKRRVRLRPFQRIDLHSKHCLDPTDVLLLRLSAAVRPSHDVAPPLHFRVAVVARAGQAFREAELTGPLF
jgi:hypothetical protein